MNSNKGINPKIVYWLTFFAFLVNIVCLVVFLKVGSSSGDTGIAMWAIFLFSFFLVSVPLHMGLLVLALVQSFLTTKNSFNWLYGYLLITAIVFTVIAAKYGAFDDFFESTSKHPPLTSAQVVMQQAFNSGPSADIAKVRQALAEGVDVNSGSHPRGLPYLVLAAKNADALTIQTLLDAGADPNKLASTQYLLSHGVAINHPSPLDLVMFAEHGDIRKSIELLLAAGAEPQNNMMKLGACRKGNLELFEYAISLTANRNIDDKVLADANGKNCIHHAAELNQVGFLQKILFSEKNENIQHLLFSANKNKQFPLDVALTKKHYAAAIEIVKAGGKANQKTRIKRVLENTSQDPVLTELKTFILQQKAEIDGY